MNPLFQNVLISVLLHHCLDCKTDHNSCSTEVWNAAALYTFIEGCRDNFTFNFVSWDRVIFLDDRCLLSVSTLPSGHWTCQSLPRQAVDWHHAVCWSVAHGTYAACNTPITWSASCLFTSHSNCVAGSKTSFPHASYMLVAICSVILSIFVLYLLWDHKSVLNFRLWVWMRCMKFVTWPHNALHPMYPLEMRA
jgi:hypothetical protein